MIPDLLPYHSHDPDGDVFIQRDGSLGAAWEITPLETETRSEDEVGEIARRLEQLAALFPEGSAAQVILVSDPGPDLSRWLDATSESGILRDLAVWRARATQTFQFAHEGSLFSARTLRIYLTLRLFPRWKTAGLAEGIRYAFRRDASIESRFRESYDRHKGELRERREAVENLLTQMGTTFRRLDLQSLRRVVFSLLNPGRKGPLPVDRADRPISEGLAFTHAEIREASVQVGSVPHTVLSMREAPRESWAGMLPLDSLSDGAIVLNIEVCSADQIGKFLAAKKRLAFCQLSGGGDRVDVSAMKEEVDRVSAEIFTEGARVYSTRVHVVTRRSAEELVNAFSRLGMELVEERALAGTLFLQCLPLAYDPENDRALRRGRRMLGLNLAHLIPLYGAFRGTASPDLLLLNRRGEPVTFSFFDSPVAPHGIIAGVSGSGKSVLANNLILSAARRGDRIFVLDRGNSYRKLCEMLGGTYVTFDPRRPRSINPCGVRLDEEKKIFLTDIVCEMTAQGQREPTVVERNLAARAVGRAFEEAGTREVLLRDIHRALRADPEPAAHDLSICLEMFVGDGAYAGFFDRPAESDTGGLLTVYELGDVAKRKDVASVLLMALIHRITEYARTHLDVRKYLIVDEAWTLLKSATTAQFLEDVLRTYRKLNASAVMVTQQVTDFQGRTGEAIRANAPNRVYLQQTSETVLAMQELLDLSPVEKEVLGRIRTVKGRFSEMLIQTGETGGLARLVPDRLSYFVSTSDAADNLRLEALIREHGDLRSALLAAARE